MSLMNKLMLVILMAILTVQYQKIQDHDKLMRYYEQHSYYPIVHTYYNRHFSKSRQFQDFLDVLQQTEYRNKDYAKFIITDCENFIQGQTFVCDELQKTKDNRAIFGYFPSSKFINFAGKKMQNPPINRKMDHFSDVYTVDELQRFFKPIIPNFYQEINNLQEYEQFLLPRYVPKLIFYSRQESVPIVMNQLGVHFFLKFDFGFVSDLTESVTSKSNTTTFPTLLIFRFNYQKQHYEITPYHQSDFSELKYEQIKSFLQPFALTEQRNDILFHKIRMPVNDNIIQTDSKTQLMRFLDMSNTWAIISEFNGIPTKLQALKDKYGKFFSYYHSLEGTSEQEKLIIFDPKQKNSFALVNDDIEFKSLESEDFLTNITAWLSKNFVVLGVRQKYGHMCSLSHSSFFRGLAYCFIARQSDYQKVSKRLGMQFDYGFVSYESRLNETKKVKGRSFKSSKYQDVYLDTQYQTKLKTKQTVDAFMEEPIQMADQEDSLADLCAYPTKKCVILFTHSSKKDRTAYDYLKDTSINYINEYQFYQIDLSCNPQFEKLIPALQKNLGGLVVYNHRTTSYVYLKARISKTTIDKFLKINLTDNKKIPYLKFANPAIVIKSCQTQSSDKPETKETIDSQQQL